METKKSKLSPKLIFTLLVLGACWSIVYIVPFIQYVWYNPFQELLGASNTQLGLLLTIYGFGNIFGCPIGGWIADRFNYKYVYVGSVLLNGLFSVLFVLKPTYSMAVLCWIGFAVASLLMNYPTHIKIIRDLANDENQGKIFGVNELCIGIFNIVFNGVIMILFTHFMEGIAGMSAAIIGIAVLSYILTIIVGFVLDNPKKKSKEAHAAVATEEKANFGRDFVLIAKNPATWLVALSIFSIYSF